MTKTRAATSMSTPAHLNAVVIGESTASDEAPNPNAAAKQSGHEVMTSPKNTPVPPSTRDFFDSPFGTHFPCS